MKNGKYEQRQRQCVDYRYYLKIAELRYILFKDFHEISNFTVLFKFKVSNGFGLTIKEDEV